MRSPRTVILVSVLTAVLFVAPASAVSASDDTNIESKQWTVLLYCGADNDYEIPTQFAMDQIVKAMRENGADIVDLNIVALVDWPGSDGTWVYELTGEGMSEASGWPSHERNTSDPAVMAEFLNFAMERYPAEKSILVIKNGHAWCGVCPDWTEENERYMMPIAALADTLEQLSSEGKRLDILAFDGDNMASIEVAYQLRDSADYFVASQQDMPIDGLPYYLFVSELVQQPDMTPKRLAERIVHNHVLYYNNTDGKKNMHDHLLSNSQMAVTASAFELAKIGPVGDAFVEVIGYMVDTEDWIPLNRPNISSARDFALIGKMGDQAGYEWLPDVYQWLDALDALVNYEDPENDLMLTSLVDNFKTAFDAALVWMGQSQILNRSGNSIPHGLNIWFPPSPIHWEEFDCTRTRTYLYDGSNVPLPAEYYCVNSPIGYAESSLDLVDPDHSDWLTFFEIYYDARWTMKHSGKAQDPLGPHPQ